MKATLAAAVILMFVGTLNAQPAASSWFTDAKYQLKDGHTLMLRDDGKVEYDGNFLFDRCDSKYSTENYIPFVITVTNARGEKELVHAALELQEVKVNGKIWFTIYESSQGPMRQSFATVHSDAQARL